MTEATVNFEQCLDYARISDVGMRRSNNQDSMAVELAPDEHTWKQRGHLFVVADGMGAHAAGEKASEMAVTEVALLYLKYRNKSAPEALQKALTDANEKIHRHGQLYEDFHNMGTTCSALALLPQGALAAHIGDSRVYRLRQGKLEQLTFDHSLVWEMRAAGQLPENDDLANLVPKNVITRSLGPNPTVKIDLEGPFPVELGDIYLLCSDGLTGPVEDEELGPLLANLPPKEACRLLVDLANLRGGPDNITAIVAKVIGPEITTQVAGTEPITLGAQKTKRQVPLWLWPLMGACFLLALIMAVSGNYIPAIVAVCAGLVFLVTILMLRYRERSSGTALGADHRFGKGPHKSHCGLAKAEFVEKLAGVIAQLREAAVDRGWEYDANRFDALCEKAVQAGKSGDHGKAVRQYARGISFMMQEIRNQRQKNASDSSVDLV